MLIIKPVSGQLVIDDEDDYKVKYRTPEGVFNVVVKGVDPFDAGDRVKALIPNAYILGCIREGCFRWL